MEIVISASYKFHLIRFHDNLVKEVIIINSFIQALRKEMQGWKREITSFRYEKLRVGNSVSEG